jgi:hypothetical protein
MRRALVLAGLLSLAGCGSGSDEAGEQATVHRPRASGSEQAPSRSQLDLEHVTMRLGSKDCGEVVQLYLEALRGRDYGVAAQVWDDPAIDAARLEAVFGRYRELQIESPEPVVEGAAGSLYCTVSGKLTDAQDPAKPPVEGSLQLKRVNDVPGATADQLRWTLRSSTFVEALERSDGGKP